MSNDLADWPRPYYRGPGGTSPSCSTSCSARSRRCRPWTRPNTDPTASSLALQLSHYDRGKHPEVLDGFRQGYVWDELKAHDPALGPGRRGGDECLVLRGELEDRAT